MSYKGDEYHSDYPGPATLHETAPDLIGDVREFMMKFGQHIRDEPSFPHEGTGILQMRLDLIREEWSELRDAIEDGHLPDTADAIADLLYVVIGLAHALGIPLAAVWREVHRSNMAKTGGGQRADGKILKPAGWKPPDIAKVLRCASKA